MREQRPSNTSRNTARLMWWAVWFIPALLGTLSVVAVLAVVWPIALVYDFFDRRRS